MLAALAFSPQSQSKNCKTNFAWPDLVLCVRRYCGMEGRTKLLFVVRCSMSPSKPMSARSTPICSVTAATWLMRAGVDKWEAAGFLGMSVEMLDRVYGHHHADHLRTAAHFIGYRPPAGVPQRVVAHLVRDEGVRNTCLFRPPLFDNASFIPTKLTVMSCKNRFRRTSITPFKSLLIAMLTLILGK